MTKEPIMIDDVDVSGCNFTLERDGKIKCECTHATGFGVICDCESWKNCDYKNYKSKEQECEELKKYRPIIDRLLKQFETYDKLKSLDVVAFVKQTFEQLDQLKVEKTRLEDDFAVQLQATLYHQSQWLKSEEKCRNYEQILKEIREKCEVLNV